MKNYELLAIFKPTLDTEELDKIVEKITEEVKSYKGSVLNIDKMGRKKLAYDVQGYRDGYFTNILLSIPAESVVEFTVTIDENSDVTVLFSDIELTTFFNFLKRFGSSVVGKTFTSPFNPWALVITPILKNSSIH